MSTIIYSKDNTRYELENLRHLLTLTRPRNPQVPHEVKVGIEKGLVELVREGELICEVTPGQEPRFIKVNN